MDFKKLFSLLLVLSLLLATIFLFGWQEILSILSGVSPVSLLALALMQCFTLFLGAYLWYQIISRIDKNLSLWRVLLFQLAGHFVESVTPSVKLGGEAAKVYLLRRYSPLSLQQASATVLVSKYISLLPFLFINLLLVPYAVFFHAASPVVFWGLLGLFLVVILLGLLVYLPSRWQHTLASGLSRPSWPLWLTRLISGFFSFISQSASAAKPLLAQGQGSRLFLLAGFVWLFYPFKVWLVITMMGFELSLPLILTVTYISYMVSMIPLLPGGSGSFEATMTLFLVLFGFSPAEGLAVAIMVRLVTFWFPMLLAGVATAFLAIRGE